MLVFNEPLSTQDDISQATACDLSLELLSTKFNATGKTTLA
jgi:hypothetical protein